MQVDRARNCFLDLHGKFSLSLSEILKKVVRPHSFWWIFDSYSNNTVFLLLYLLMP